MRKRDCESTVTIEYLRNLWQAYEEFLTEIARIIPVIRVNYEEFRTADEMADVIIRYSICTVHMLRLSLCIVGSSEGDGTHAHTHTMLHHKAVMFSLLNSFCS